MSTLTVYETVLYSALLRLPREMSIEAKRFRTLETLQELGILGIKDSRIGDSGARSISGGEKRRVSIACELVTSPSVLFLDEATSGLDSANALNVVECLVNLARTYRRTVVLSLHQPSSKIVSLLDKLILLASGKLVYSGPFSACDEYFSSIGHACPSGHNILEYLIDLTAAASKGGSTSSIATPARQDEETVEQEPTEDISALELATRTSTSGAATPSGSIGRTAGKLAAGVRSAFGSRNGTQGHSAIPRALAVLVKEYQQSDVASKVQSEISGETAHGERNGGSGETLNDVEEGDEVLRGYRKATLWTQLRILSGRSFKNLYRNPQLMLAHYLLSFILGGFVGLLFYGVTNDIAGFQNRLGLCFFTLALFGFSTLTSLGIFANERQLFVRERANGYYSPLTYFFAKLIFDSLPLRVIPPLLFGPTIYFTVGLVPQVANFWCFILTLVLFSLAASSIVFFISVSIRDTGVANLVGTLTMLISLLFAGLLINRDKIPMGLRWLLYISPFHASYEALLVNELRSLSLVERKFGVDLDVPAATLLSSFGFDSQAYWQDQLILTAIFLISTAMSLFWLVCYVKERR
jgi:ABC-type multidrug transport system ATPase subunit